MTISELHLDCSTEDEANQSFRVFFEGLKGFAQDNSVSSEMKEVVTEMVDSLVDCQNRGDSYISMVKKINRFIDLLTNVYAENYGELNVAS
jgi:hypothetical protein